MKKKPFYALKAHMLEISFGLSPNDSFVKNTIRLMYIFELHILE